MRASNSARLVCLATLCPSCWLLHGLCCSVCCGRQRQRCAADHAADLSPRLPPLAAHLAGGCGCLRPFLHLLSTRLGANSPGPCCQHSFVSFIIAACMLSSCTVLSSQPVCEFSSAAVLVLSRQGVNAVLVVYWTQFFAAVARTKPQVAVPMLLVWSVLCFHAVCHPFRLRLAVFCGGSGRPCAFLCCVLCFVVCAMHYVT